MAFWASCPDYPRKSDCAAFLIGKIDIRTALNQIISTLNHRIDAVSHFSITWPKGPLYDDAGNVIETHEYKGDFKEW